MPEHVHLQCWTVWSTADGWLDACPNITDACVGLSGNESSVDRSGENPAPDHRATVSLDFITSLSQH